MMATRLPAAPLLEAIEERRRSREATLGRLLGPTGVRYLWRVRAESSIGVTAHVGAQLCAAIDRDPHELWGSAFDAARPRLRPAATPTSAGHALVHLPAAPLLEAIEQRCRDRGEISNRGAVNVGKLFGESGKTPQRRAYGRARRSGRLTLRAVEDLCDFLGWHPREVYGGAYDAAALAGCPADFDPWEGIA